MFYLFWLFCYFLLRQDLGRWRLMRKNHIVTSSFFYIIFYSKAKSPSTMVDNACLPLCFFVIFRRRKLIVIFSEFRLFRKPVILQRIFICWKKLVRWEKLFFFQTGLFLEVFDPNWKITVHLSRPRKKNQIFLVENCIFFVSLLVFEYQLVSRSRLNWK